jgi:hypothetical protein
MSHLADARLALIVESHQRIVGRPLLVEPFDPKALWVAPLAIVAHGTEEDPVFFYGNKLALQLFEMDFAAFTRLPSRLSAEPLAREERARLLARVTEFGFVDDYSGMRISGRNKRFMITQATVWNLIDETGIYCGQAAAFTLPD